MTIDANGSPQEAASSQFDSAAETYEASDAMPLRVHVEQPSILMLAGDLAGLTVLDPGCGTGLYTRLLARSGAKRVVGADSSDGMLTAARAREDADPLGVTYVHQDLTDGAVPGEFASQVDLAVAVYVLCYANTYAALVTMCRTVREFLRPGGTLLAATLNPDYADDAILPNYYASYGFTLTARSPDTQPGTATGELAPTDGTPVTLDVLAFNDAPALAVEAFWWSYDAYDQALHEAGFPTVSWHDMDVTPKGIDTYGRDHWRPYLTRPHARVLRAR